MGYFERIQNHIAGRMTGAKQLFAHPADINGAALEQFIDSQHKRFIKHGVYDKEVAGLLSSGRWVPNLQAFLDDEEYVGRFGTAAVLLATPTAALTNAASRPISVAFVVLSGKLGLYIDGVLKARPCIYAGSKVTQKVLEPFADKMTQDDIEDFVRFLNRSIASALNSIELGFLK